MELQSKVEIQGGGGFGALGLWRWANVIISGLCGDYIGIMENERDEGFRLAFHHGQTGLPAIMARRC